MSIVAILTDTHIGVKNGSEVFHDAFEKFYTNTFFPTLKQHGVTKVLHLGDLFDKRKSVDFLTVKRSREYLFDPMRDAGIEMRVLVGNHDIFLRQSLEINSPDLLLSEYSNITAIDSPRVINVDGLDILMLPWICSDNYVASMDAIKTAKAGVCMGHLELSGYLMNIGLESHEGFASSLFERFDMVFSGHFHHRSSKGNIHYLGNTSQLTHQDCGDVRGFHLFNTDTRELTFVPNPYDMFARFVYDESPECMATDVTTFKDKYVKVVVQKKTDFYAFDSLMDKVYNCGALDVKVMELLSDMTADAMDDDINISDTQTVLQHFIDSAQVDVDREKLSQYMKSLYLEALHADL